MSKRKLLEWESLHGFKNEVVPAQTGIPEWYRQIPRNVVIPGDSNTMSAKHCLPFLESMTTGYYVTLNTDIYVDRSQGFPTFRYAIEGDGVSARHSVQTDPMPVPHGYEPNYWTWTTRACIRLPEGYTALYVHPLNRFDLPFITLSGVIDNDFPMMGGNIPFFLKEGFEGIIPQGTPVLQVIPFLREDWDSKKVKGLANEGRELETKSPHDWYRKTKWQRKSYK